MNVGRGLRSAPQLSEEDRVSVEVADLFERIVLKCASRYAVKDLMFGPTVCALGVPFVNSPNWPEADATAIQKTLLDEIWPIGFADLVACSDDLPSKLKAPLAAIAAALNERRQA